MNRACRRFSATSFMGGSAAVAILKLLAREFSGDLSLDPYSKPERPAGAWSFVRGEDLGLRVVAELAPGAERAILTFPDRNLRRPALVDLATGEAVPQFNTRRTEDACVGALISTT